MQTEFKLNHVILADDDDDDCSFFSEALARIHPDLKLSVENNGLKLMEYLYMPPEPAPDAIFLDLNMPLKSGMECLHEIRLQRKLKNSIVVVITTSGYQNDIDNSYRQGANFFITKPVNFADMCGLISKAFESIVRYGAQQPPREEFVISA